MELPHALVTQALSERPREFGVIDALRQAAADLADQSQRLEYLVEAKRDTRRDVPIAMAPVVHDVIGRTFDSPATTEAGALEMSYVAGPRSV